MKGGSSRSSPKYFRSRAHGKPSSTVLVRTRLAKSYSRLLPAEVAYFRTKRCTLAGLSAAITVLPARTVMPLAPFQPSPLASQPTFPKQEPSVGDPHRRYGSWRYTELPVGVVKAASVNAPKAAVKTE